MPEHDVDHEEDAADVDRHVSNIEDWEPLQVDEIDDRAVQETAAAEDPIGEVAEPSPGDKTSRHSRQLARHAAAAPCQPEHHPRGDDPDERPDALRLREG